MKFICTVCGWIYDEQKGESGCDIDPDTSFEDLPEGFECPECYANKGAFVRWMNDFSFLSIFFLSLAECLLSKKAAGFSLFASSALTYFCFVVK